MVRGHPKISRWLQPLAIGLLVIAAFAPLSDSLDRILSGVGLLLLVPYIAAVVRDELREWRTDQPGGATSSSEQR